MIPDEIIEDIETAVAEIMKKEGVDEYKYNIEGKSESGENYMGEVIFVKVDPVKGRTEPYNLVIKTAKRSQDIRAKLPVHLFYNRELYMYSDVFPSFEKLAQEVNPDIKLDFIPKMYWSNAVHNRETIVLENLKSEGFKLHDRKKTWNLEHSKFTMEHYGKLHGFSMALKEKRPELFKELKKNLGTISQAFTENVDVKKFYEEPVEHIMNLLRNVGRDDLVTKYYDLMGDCADVFRIPTSEEDSLAICHMDCWNNNFMFKYKNEDESSPSEVRFLDFQLAVLDSPAKDLSYNIYATCDNTCLEHFDQLLQTYLDSLRQTLESLGCDPQKCLGTEDLQRHWRKYGIYGLLFAITIIKIELINMEDAPSMEEMAKNENLMDGFNVKVTDQDEYDRRILGVYLHFGDNFLLKSF